MPKNTHSTSLASSRTTSAMISRSPLWLVPPPQPTRGLEDVPRRLVKRVHGSGGSMLGTTRISLCMLDKASASAWVVTRSEEHTSELQSLMRISYDVFCLQKNTPR